MIKLKQQLNWANPLSQHPLNTGLMAYYIHVDNPAPCTGLIFPDLCQNLPLSNYSDNASRAPINERGLKRSYHTSWQNNMRCFYREISPISMSVYCYVINKNFEENYSFSMDAGGGARAWGFYVYADVYYAMVKPTYTFNLGANQNNYLIHFTLVRQDTDNCPRVYVNGRLYSTGTSSDYGTTTGHIYLIWRNNGYGLDGYFYNSRLWSRPLSASEVWAVYQEDINFKYETLNFLENKVYSFYNVGGATLHPRSQPRGNLTGVLRGVL